MSGDGERGANEGGIVGTSRKIRAVLLDLPVKRVSSPPPLLLINSKGTVYLSFHFFYFFIFF